MKVYLLFLALLVCASCTTMRSAELSPDELQSQIRSGEIIAVGDDVEIVTADGARHQFEIVSIDDALIAGDSGSVAIDDVVALKTRTFSGGKTALLAGGSLVLYQVLAAIAIAATVGL